MYGRPQQQDVDLHCPAFAVFKAQRRSALMAPHAVLLLACQSAFSRYAGDRVGPVAIGAYKRLSLLFFFQQLGVHGAFFYLLVRVAAPAYEGGFDTILGLALERSRRMLSGREIDVTG